MRKPALISIILAAVFVLGGWLYATPYRLLATLQHAVKNRDAATINSYVDYPAVREHLKTSLSQQLGHMLLAERRTDSGMTAFASLFAGALVAPAVDSFMQPENLALLLQARMPESGKKLFFRTESQASAATPKEDATVNAHYVGLNRFEVTLHRQQPIPMTVVLEFGRHGLNNWQLVALTLPLVKS